MQHLTKIAIIIVIAIGAVLTINWYGEKQLTTPGVVRGNTSQVINPIKLSDTDSTTASS